MNRNFFTIFTLVLTLAVLISPTLSQSPRIIRRPPVDKWVTAEGQAPGTDLKAKDHAIALALRKAVEQECGVFIKAQSKTRDYKAIYDKVFANTVGYVVEYEVKKTWIDKGIYHAKVTARVSTRRFEESWAVIAHTVHQESNPRVLIAIAEETRYTIPGGKETVEEAGNVQAILEDFFLEKGIMLVDRLTTEKVSKRDILVASFKDDTDEVAAMGARFKADVVIIGTATAKYGSRIEIAGTTMHRYVATLRTRAIRTDSAQIIASKSFGPVTVNTLQRMGGGDKALAKLAADAAPKLLSAVVEAWRKQVQVARNIRLNISGMDYKTWKLFSAEVKKLRGVQGLRRREITAGVANIDVEYSFDTESLADKMIELKSVKLEVTEITPNRIKLKVLAIPPAPESQIPSTKSQTSSNDQ